MSRFNVVGLFCEDVREEVNNRHSIIGIMPDNTYVKSIPSAFLRLGFYVRVHLPVENRISTISVRLRFPDGKEDTFPGFDENAIRGAQEKAQSQGGSEARFLVHAVGMNLPIPSPGMFSLIARIGEEDVFCGSLGVSVKADETSSSSTASL